MVPFRLGLITPIESGGSNPPFRYERFEHLFLDHTLSQCIFHLNLVRIIRNHYHDISFWSYLPDLFTSSSNSQNEEIHFLLKTKNKFLPLIMADNGFEWFFQHKLNSISSKCATQISALLSHFHDINSLVKQTFKWNGSALFDVSI